MRRSSIQCLAVLSLFAVASVQGGSGKGGLRTNYSKIVADHLPIGCAISMKGIANLPIQLGNNFDVPVLISVVAKQPDQARTGYEPIPDPSWIKPEQDEILVPPGEERFLDVVIHIPDDEALLGKKYEAQIVVATSRTGKEKPSFNIQYQITGILLFSIAPVRNAAALEQALKQQGDASYDVAPCRVDLYGIKPGSAVSMDPSAIISNRSDHAMQFTVASILPDVSTCLPNEGSSYRGKESDVEFKASAFSVPAHEAAQLPMVLHVPEEISMAEEGLFYLVSIRSGALMNMEQFVRIYLWGKSKPSSIRGSAL
ncbi:MAG: hypothetical protein V2A34_04430 [Lentisphaerota bacterium]